MYVNWFTDFSDLPLNMEMALSCAVLKKSCKQHPIKQQLYGHLPPSHKPSQQDEQDMLGFTGEVR